MDLAMEAPSERLERFRDLVDKEDYAGFASELCDVLGFATKVELLPLVRGMLCEAIRETDEVQQLKAARGSRRGFSAFAKAGGVETPSKEAPGKDDAEAVAGARRRWQRTLREMFTTDAAICLQNDALEKYKTIDFRNEAGIMDASWQNEDSVVQRFEMMDELCLKYGLVNLLPMYGFSGDFQGWQAASSQMEILAKTDAQVRRHKDDNRRFIISLFPHAARNSFVGDESKRKLRAG
mmetsp:Transcript_145729/g.254275  ORF Transcript_145729/g.254275 Transcript_145729/m.254275 type:complete len:237 (-) Transcript_145729:100-810(-)